MGLAVFVVDVTRTRLLVHRAHVADVERRPRQRQQRSAVAQESGVTVARRDGSEAGGQGRADGRRARQEATNSSAV